ncbi:erythrocyte membrane protein 1, PfEMP1, putative, partial [Plasmodium sp. gorilla clade G1]
MEPKKGVTIESKLSARDILENIASEIKVKREKGSKYNNILKGTLSKARFSDAYSSYFNEIRSGYYDSCGLDHKYNTNIIHVHNDGRNPCHGREKNRFDENVEAYCNSDKIRVIGKESDGTACAPFRRQNLCDRNLEYLINKNTENTHDLLGNVLVTAKYEGDIIVSNHPDKDIKGNKSSICTSLARSFADIGDIVRGRDMFKRNNHDNVENGLREVFKKIYNGLKYNGIKHYDDDGSENYVKLREDWWTANRDQVWQAITCKAPQGANYFRNTSGKTMEFTSAGKCRRNDNSVPTNLDYVPQYLRWYDEWAEEFCRKKKIKLEKVKEACRGKTDEKYCSHNACDCEQSSIKTRDFVLDKKCVECSIECHRYEDWINNRLTEFKNQKDKYESEINRYNSSTNSNKDFNNKYYKDFYDKLKVEKYKSVNQFLELLNKENKCKNIGHEDITDFNKSDHKKTFSGSIYCQVCPYCGVECRNGRCKKKEETDDNCIKTQIYTPPSGVTPTDINVLYSGDEHGDIAIRLNKFCSDSKSYNDENSELWQCYYDNKQNNNNTDNNICIKGTNKNITHRYIMNFDNFIQFWVTSLLMDTTDWDRKLKTCINNNNNDGKCITECYENCTCFDNWIDQKEKEWSKVKEHIAKEKENGKNKYCETLQNIFSDYNVQVIEKIYKENPKWKERIENLKDIECSKINIGNKHSQYEIDIFLKNLKKDATQCKTKIAQNACDKPHAARIINPGSHPNPCGGGRDQSANNIVSVRDVVEKMQGQVNGRDDDGISKLKGDISLAKFRNGANPIKLDGGKICEINTTHSNDSRRGRPNYKGPCQGKDNKKIRFNIGENWKTGDTVSSKDHVFLPPRRQHFCTSNLENLSMNSVTNSTNVNASFLVDVLLAANKQVEHTLNDYKPESDQEGKCRAIRYSFADLGDIIKGTDMWDANKGETDTQRNLEQIFGKIKDELKGKLNGKYDSDKDDKKYINLRADWWEANRAKVWEAMQCSLKTLNSSTGDCKYNSGNSVPPDDYIPQRLRWMTEWVEWYCKEQSRLYGDLEKGCGECKDKEKCTEGDVDCGKCKAACGEYKNKIKTWAEEWDKIQQKYGELYTKALQSCAADSSSAPKSTADKDQHVIEFLKQLQQKNDVTTSAAKSDVYSTASGYIHQELQNMECKEQKIFCEKPSNDKNKYTFKELPPDYQKECACEKRPKSPQKKPEVPKVKPPTSACDIVKNFLRGKDERSTIYGCNKKKDVNWECQTNIDPKHAGACMPPRRQKLCIYYFGNQSQIPYMKTQDKLREAFIKSAAGETFLSCQKYKTDNKGDTKLQRQLENGEIPEEIKRQMFYTFGDLRDFLFGTDISKDHGEKSELKKQIDSLFQNNDGKPPNGKTREQWWNEYGSHIWEAMLCALENFGAKNEILTKKYEYSTLKFSDTNDAPKLTDFVTRPQFLRWMTEWGEDFCKKQKKHYMDLVEKCTECTVSTDGNCTKQDNCTNCSSQCREYQTFITQWKDQWERQTNKYDELYAKTKDTSIAIADSIERKFIEYLKELNDLKGNTYDNAGKYINKKGYIKDCEKSQQNNFDKNSSAVTDEKYALRDYPNDHEHKCNCKVNHPPDACSIVDGILSPKNSKSYADGCKWKYGKIPLGLGWLCNNKGSKEGDTTVCIPPRRRRLYLGNLKNLKDGKTSEIELRQAFIECAAIETFFAWHEFKKEKEKEKKQENEEVIYGRPLSTDEEAQNLLKSGIIYDDFKRQMFYTLSDYRDILLGKDIGVDVSEVEKNIKRVFSSNGDKTPNGQSRLDWWGKNGPNIWKGMLCALSYNTETKEMDKELRDALTKVSTNNQNTFDHVAFNGGFNADISTKLTDFVKRPPFVRSLEEWAHEFCRKKKIKIDKIQKDCRGERGENNCDDDGFECNEMRPSKDGRFETFNCLSCANSCKSYKKWINTKQNEFEKKKSEYEMKIKKLESNSHITYDENFVGNLSNNYSSVESFLKELKGPCSNYNSGECEIDFNNREVTFGPVKNCAPCSVFRVKCDNGNCSETTERTCNGKTYMATDNFENNKHTIKDVVMRVTDNNPNEFPSDLKGVCKGTGIFTGIKEKKWLCGYMCDLDICKPITSDNKKVNKQNILIRALFKQWVENFLEDYNKINNKISHCMKNGEGSTCKNGCRDKCKCVDEWIKLKYDEWKIILERYIKQYSTNNSDVVYPVKSFLQGGPFYSDIQKAIKPCKDLNEFEDLSECTDTTNSGNATSRKKDVVECLLDKLQKKIEKYNAQHREGTHTPCPLQSKDEQLEDDENNHDTPDIPTDDVAPPFCNVPANPCGDKDATNVVGVEEVAKEIQGDARTKMLERSRKSDGQSVKSKGRENDESVLKGNISKAIFKDGASPSPLKENEVCQINNKHSNDIRRDLENYKGPCEGKDGDNGGERMKIGILWKTGKDVKMTQNDLYLPPRRQHICTSNLEKIDVSSVTKKDNVNASFFVDVLLSAKMDAAKIKDLYKRQNKKRDLSEENDKATVCRAIKYSFADIGDIIRGTDLWEHKDFKDLETKLVTIFEKIKEKNTDEATKKKYVNDNKPYTQLRADWWEANRDEVWKAMQCPTKPPVTTNCDTTTVTPLVDYIPQRLRWMMEWAEWYCKYQSKEYEDLRKGCEECRSKVSDEGKGAICENEEKCKGCREKCVVYKQHIEKWENQWTKIKEKYEELYKKAKEGGATSSDPKDEKDVVHFLTKLHEKNKESNKIYETAAGFIHQEAKYLDCKTQTQFCDKKKGVTSTSGTDNDKEYAFREKPHDHDDKCDCRDKTAPPPKKAEVPPRPPLPGFPPPQQDPCEIVEELLNGKDGTSKIDGCDHKYDLNEESYPKWDCDKNIHISHYGACTPPRTQELCIYYLTELTFQTKEKEDDLRKAFIKCAATETFLLWNKYKKDKEKEQKTGVKHANLDDELKRGEIPEEFKRQMFYTFGDYRDICLDIEISKKNDDVSGARYNIGEVFSEEGGKSPGKLTRADWWNEYCPQIWEGMVCALSHAVSGSDQGSIKRNNKYSEVKFSDGNTNLDTFCSRPQSLRWLTEWGEDFCKQRKKQLDILMEVCKHCKVSDTVIRDGIKTCVDKNKCDACKDHCKKYNEWLETWKKHYEKQKKTYTDVKGTLPYNEYSDVKNSDDARDYLDKQLKNMICTNGSSSVKCDYKCMDKSTSSTDDIPKSLHYPPDEFKDQCDCKDAVAPAEPPKVPEKKEKKRPQPQPDLPTPLKNAMLSSTIMWSVGIGFAAI